MGKLLIHIYLLIPSLVNAQDFVTTFPSYTFTCKGVSTQASVAGVFLPGGDGCCGSGLVRSMVQIMPGQYMADIASFSIMSTWTLSWESKFQGEYLHGFSASHYSLSFENNDTEKLDSGVSKNVAAELSATNQVSNQKVKMMCEIIKQSLFN